MKGTMLSRTPETQETCLVGVDMKTTKEETTLLDLSVTVPSPKSRSKNTAGGFKKKPTTLPNETVEYLKAWMMSPEHVAHPYPTESEKAAIMADTGLELKQLTNWFVNNRKRYWKPRVEARLGNKEEVDTTLDTSPALKREISILTSGEVVPSTRSSKRRISKETPPVAVSPSSVVHLVSGHNSVASSDGTSSGSDSDEERCSAASTPIRGMELPTIIQEPIDVHILRPSQSFSAIPELSDVTVLGNVPSERILRTYANCMLTYSAAEGNKDSARCRDAEIVRLKKKYLALYLKEHDDMAEAIRNTLAPSTPPRKRPKLDALHIIPSVFHMVTSSPRPKYRRHSIDIWKEACQTANHVYDDQELPSLEEATRLFGYAR